MSWKFAAILVPVALQAQMLVQPPDPATREVAVLAHPVMRGDRLSATDFELEQLPVARSRGALTAEEAQGLEAQRPLPSGAIVRVTDLAPVKLVRRGEPVLIIFRAGGLLISTQGKALASAGAGDPVRVVANSTQRTLDGTVAPDGSVLVGAR